MMLTQSLQDAMAVAIDHHRSARFQDADGLYQQILSTYPDHAQTHYLAGIVALQTGQYELAVKRLARATELAPSNGGYFDTLGTAFTQLGSFADALNAHQRAIFLAPNMAEFHNNLGNALKRMGQLDRAVRAYEKALERNPSYADAYNHLGSALRECGKSTDAIDQIQRAIEMSPENPNYHYNLGNALKSAAQYERAIKAYRRALELNPQFAEAYNNLGNTYREIGKLDEAIESYQRALALRSNHLRALQNLGNVFEQQGKRSEAIECYEKLVALLPDSGGAAALLFHQYQHVCWWEDQDKWIDIILRSLESNDRRETHDLPSPFTVLCLPTESTPRQQYLSAKQWVESLIPQSFADNRSLSAVRSIESERIRIGYLSGDFRSHPVAYSIPELLEQHDRERFVIYAYSFGQDDGSAIRRRIVRAVDRFVEIGSLSAEQAADQIRSDGIDILVDLQGHTFQARTKLLTLKPAPIQVNYLGYASTMGADFWDYILVDDYIVSRHHQPFFSETLVRLPGCFMVNDRRREIDGKWVCRDRLGLPEDAVVLCGFSTPYKITRDVFACWCRVLQKAPQAVLWLLDSNRQATTNLRRFACERGIASQQIYFAQRMPMAQHLARTRVADLFLDTFPYNQHTTASDALRMGVPLVTCSGNTFVSRVAGSLLTSLGLSELIASGLEEYERLVAHLVDTPVERQRIRNRLDSLRLTSDVFNGRSFARKVEEAYRGMVKASQKQAGRSLPN